MLFSFLIAFVIATPVTQTTRPIRLQANDGKIVQFDPAVVSMSSFIENVDSFSSDDKDSEIEGNDVSASTYTIAKVRGPILEKIARYVLEHKNDASMTQEEMRQEEISEW
jgi:hypothetical protein